MGGVAATVALGWRGAFAAPMRICWGQTPGAGFEMVMIPMLLAR